MSTPNKPLDINLIKLYVYQETPTDKTKIVSYYQQLKNILFILSDRTRQEQQQQQQQIIPNNDHFSIIESIESKMKFIESHFSDTLNLTPPLNGQHNEVINIQTPTQNTKTTTEFYDNYEGHDTPMQTTVSHVQIPSQQQQQQYQQQQQLLEQQRIQQQYELQKQQNALLNNMLDQTKKKSSSHHHRHSGPPEIPPEEIIFDPKTDLLGGGAYGKVYKATCRGKKVAVKVPKKQTLSESELKSFKNEVEIMRQIFHPNVVLFLGACTKPGKVMIVSELMQSDLEKLIHNPDVEPPSLFQRMKMAYDAALGMNWLHGICNILHRDLKLANLMIGKDKTVKIGDFGFSQVIKSGSTLLDQKGPKGTALYMAPEVMMKQEFNEKADVYSFGLILYELATCEELFPEYSEIDPFYEAICKKRLRPTIPQHFPKSLQSLITRCWDHDPHNRPSFSDISTRMNEVLIDIAISSPESAAFWKYNFASPEEIKWVEFISKLSNAVSVEVSSLKFLSKLFVSIDYDEENEGFVNLERFDLMNKWFGNFFNSRVGPSILNEMNELLKRRWFHFDISRDVSERRLRGRPENTFLIRLSLNDPVKTPFTISKIKSSKPTHKRVAREDCVPSAEFPMGYKLIVPLDGNDLVFNSMISMIDKLKSIGNLGPDCPHSEIKIPYLTD